MFAIPTTSLPFASIRCFASRDGSDRSLFGGGEGAMKAGGGWMSAVTQRGWGHRPWQNFALHPLVGWMECARSRLHGIRSIVEVLDSIPNRTDFSMESVGFALPSVYDAADFTAATTSWIDFTMSLTDFVVPLTKSSANRISFEMDLIDSIIDLIDSSIDLTASAIDLIASAMDLIDSAMDLIKSATDLTDSDTNLIDSAMNLTDSTTDLIRDATFLTQTTTSLIKYTVQKATVSEKSGRFHAKTGLFQTIQPATSGLTHQDAAGAASNSGIGRQTVRPATVSGAASFLNRRRLKTCGPHRLKTGAMGTHHRPMRCLDASALPASHPPRLPTRPTGTGRTPGSLLKNRVNLTLCHAHALRTSSSETGQEHEEDKEVRTARPQYFQHAASPNHCAGVPA